MPVSTKTAVAVLQWGPLHEPDEAHEATTALRLQLKAEAREDRATYVTSLRVTEPDSATFLAALSWVVESHPKLQVIYISAHGVLGGLCFDTEGSSPVGYDTIGTTVAAPLSGRETRPIVVFGACYALSSDSNVHHHMPREVLELIGFTSTPTAANVAALISAVLKSDEELLQKVTQAAATASNAGEDVTAAVQAEYDAHSSNLSRFVSGSTGLAIRHMSQDEHGMWTVIR